MEVEDNRSVTVPTTGPPFARLRDFYIYDLKHEVVLYGRDCTDLSYYRILIFHKIQQSLNSRSQSTIASAQSSPSSLTITRTTDDYQKTSLKTDPISYSFYQHQHFASILSKAIQNDVQGEKISTNEQFNSLNDKNAMPQLPIQFSEFRIQTSFFSGLLLSLKKISQGRRILKSFGLIGCIK